MIQFNQQDCKIHKDQLISLPVTKVIQEADDVCTFRLDNSQGLIPPHQPGMFVKVCLDINGVEVWRSFSISSSPHQRERIDLTIKRNHAGQVGNYFLITFMLAVMCFSKVRWDNFTLILRNMSSLSFCCVLALGSLP